MNNYGILKKISKKSGVPETESTAFFEILVKKISKVLKDDEIIKLNDIGFFKIAGRDQNKIIIFSDSEVFDEQNSVFYLINDSEQVFDPVDSFFSISLDKPEIPLNERIDSEFFVPPAGYELRSFMESKADDLLLESKIIKPESSSKEKIEEQIIAPPEIQIDEKIKIEDDKAEKKDILSEDEIENISDEIEKNESYEVKTEDSISNAELQEIKEDFFKDDEPSEIKIEDYKFSEIEKINDEPQIENEPKENVINKTDKFQKVTSLLSKIPYDPDEVSGLNQDIENKSYKPEKEEIDEQGFSKVKFNRIKSIEDETKKENLDTSSLDDYELIDESIFNEDTDLDKSISESLDEKAHAEEENLDEVKKKIKVERNRKIPLVPIIFLVLIAAAFIIYKFLGNNDQGNAASEIKNEAAFTPSDPKIIARNYEIPVNYPYKKGNDLIFNAIDPSVYLTENSTNGTQKTVESNQVKAAAEDKSVQNNFSQSPADLENAEPIPAENYQEITNYIYSDGKTYFIQVASWNSLARAERHNSNLLEKGYDSLIEKLISPKGKIYYIVRLGNFNSLQEAEKYLKNN